jgi:hypothetical protein
VGVTLVKFFLWIDMQTLDTFTVDVFPLSPLTVDVISFKDHKSFPWPDVKQSFDVFAAVKRGTKRFTTFQVVGLSFSNTPQQNPRE